jgi:hypothetical protein
VCVCVCVCVWAVTGRQGVLPLSLVASCCAGCLEAWAVGEGL